ncbi:site-specific DNA-methyltransferase [Sandaracinus amylolyticus]|uniref:site-specific DNA-methyltransferase n=1 Tax=Sandaracinus amylolyticus TaxID=927083 RepID=UPI00147018C9|nr:site-specific DNA-methyltransferase [Sandaracinus amylolyticus]
MSKRDVLSQLARDELLRIVDAHGIEVSDRRVRDRLVDGIARARRVDLAVELVELPRDRLKDLCRALGLDERGREKGILVDRLIGKLTIESSDAGRGGERDESGMATKKKRAGGNQTSLEGEVGEYRHDEKRKNNPPAGLVEFERLPAKRKKEYAYDPHLDPQLVWAGKEEHAKFEIDTVSLHIHERVSTQAILRAVKREEQEESQLNLFAKPELPSSKEIDFYGHEVGWSNRMILGDSLLVINSLLERENMAGQVQCIFMDPPYGVKFNSNFQPSISRRDVKDGDDASLTREPEQVQAYRDTWELGIHSYLSYLRDRFLVAKDLLNEAGSLFVQISDENVHRVRFVLDEVFGAENFVSQVVFRKTTGKGGQLLDNTYDVLLWFARDRGKVKYRPVFEPRSVVDDDNLRFVELADGTRRRMTDREADGTDALPPRARAYRPNPLTNQRPASGNDLREYYLDGKRFTPGAGTFRSDKAGLDRLQRAGRLLPVGNTLTFIRYLDDFPFKPRNDIWDDTRGSGFGDAKLYVVQTGTKAIARCILMTTDPGDLVLDPTCGSGTTAYVAEQWGRRWITCDTSRVALSLARQRLITAKFPYYELRSNRVRDGFKYKTVPHITLKSIAQNPKIDACKTKEEIDRVIRESAEQETLYDQPFEDKKRVRVSGPFTVEAIPLPSMEDTQRDAGGPVSKSAAVPGHFSDAVTDYLSTMVELLRQTGIVLPGNKRIRFPALRTVKGNYEWFHAEGGSDAEGDPRTFAISFGPRHGPVTPTQVLGAIAETRGADVLVFAGFACDPEARKMIDAGVPGREVMFAHAAPDILVGDLLKKRKTDQLFAVFGAPDVRVHPENGGSLVSVELVGIDLYDPTTGFTSSAKGDGAAAILVDHDYDGKSFCVSQALFPGGGANAWEKLQKALKGAIDEDKFAQLRTTRSLPFKPGHKVAVKVIDDRGNEVIKIVDARRALKK